MKTPTLYNMIVQSEDKNRTLIEALVCALLIVSVVVSVFQVAVQPVVLPGPVATNDQATELRA